MNAVMPFAETWMGLEMIILSEVSQRQIYVISHVWNLIVSKRDTNELTYRTEMEIKLSKTNL